MSDAALSAPPSLAGEAFEKRLAARHRAERRFETAGVAAVAIAGLALATLLGSLLAQGVSALTAHEITLEVAIPEDVDPEGTGDPAVIRRAGFNGMIQASLRELLPQVEGRSELRELFGLVSSVNAGTLAARVVEEPYLVGREVSFSVPISDDLDIYFKGKATPRERRRGEGTARVRAVGEGVEIISTAPDFAPALAAVKRDLLREAERAEAEIPRLEDLLADAQGETQARARRARLETVQARADELRARASDPDAPERLTATTPSLLIRIGGGVVRSTEASADRITGEWLLRGDATAEAAPGAWSLLFLATPQADRQATDRQIAYAEELAARGEIRRVFNHWLFTRSDSREPELAGMKGSLIGSLLTMFVTLALAMPIGVATAIYLEEFAPKNRWTDIIEVNINNLAAVPSIVFGLLGLFVFITLLGLPRSSPLVGGMVLALITLPTVIISTRVALKAVPPSIRAAALAVGASPVQTVFHHVLPLAAPGILTGAIIGIARALGETAPLLMIGMVAFVADPPTSLTSPATVMPVQVFLWADSAERAFESRTAALILSLLALMVVMNLAAVLLRRRFERRW